MSAVNLEKRRSFDQIAWNAMRYSGVLLIFLAFGHVLLQDVIVGVHRIDLDYVAMRWANWGWRIYDLFLLAFAFAHGMNGVRQVLSDFIHQERHLRAVNVALLVVWLVVTLIGAVAIFGGVRPVQ